MHANNIWVKNQDRWSGLRKILQRASLVVQMVKVSACNAGDPGLIPEWGRSSGEGNGKPLQYSCLENSMDGGASWATVHGISKSRTQVSDFTLVPSLPSWWMFRFKTFNSINTTIHDSVRVPPMCKSVCGRLQAGSCWEFWMWQGLAPLFRSISCTFIFGVCWMGKWNLIELECLTGSSKASCLDSRGPSLSIFLWTTWSAPELLFGHWPY